MMWHSEEDERGSLKHVRSNSDINNTRQFRQSPTQISTSKQRNKKPTPSLGLGDDDDDVGGEKRLACMWASASALTQRTLFINSRRRLRNIWTHLGVLANTRTRARTHRSDSNWQVSHYERVWESSSICSSEPITIFLHVLDPRLCRHT